VVPVATTVTWINLAAILKMYATAWADLHGNLALDSQDTVLVRGAPSALGQAAVNVAAGHGSTVIATTRDPGRAGPPARHRRGRTIRTGHPWAL
jgi:NADPH:quinone reductase-like Zn-dependent oxidoreductase